MRRFTDNEMDKQVMVHGAGIQVVVIRVFQVVSQPAWNVATAASARECQLLASEHLCRNFGSSWAGQSGSDMVLAAVLSQPALTSL